MSLKQEGNTWIWQPVPKSPLRKMISCSFLPLLFLLFSIHFFYFGFNLWNVLPFLGLLFIYYTWSSTIICHGKRLLIIFNIQYDNVIFLESITLWEKLGFQLETQTGNGKTTRKFIPKENLVDVLIHEGIIGCKVIYALAFR